MVEPRELMSLLRGPTSAAKAETLLKAMASNLRANYIMDLCSFQA